jgi:hypothetical protein
MNEIFPVNPDHDTTSCTISSCFHCSLLAKTKQDKHRIIYQVPIFCTRNNGFLYGEIFRGGFRVGLAKPSLYLGKFIGLVEFSSFHFLSGRQGVGQNCVARPFNHLKTSHNFAGFYESMFLDIRPQTVPRTPYVVIAASISGCTQRPDGT